MYGRRYSPTLNAQVTEVNKAFLSVSKLVSVGNRVVFDSECSYIESTKIGEWFPLVANNGNYVLRLCVHKDQQKHSF